MDIELDTLHLMTRYAINSPTVPKKQVFEMSEADVRKVRSITRKLTKNANAYPEYVQNAFQEYASCILEFDAGRQESALHKESQVSETDSENKTEHTSMKNIENISVALLGAPPDPAQAVKKGLNIKVRRPIRVPQVIRGEK